jgi:hypothetical protein
MTVQPVPSCLRASGPPMARRLAARLAGDLSHGRTVPLSWDLSVERVTGIEPALSAWEADVLPLNYTRADLQ